MPHLPLYILAVTVAAVPPAAIAAIADLHYLYSALRARVPALASGRTVVGSHARHPSRPARPAADCGKR